MPVMRRAVEPTGTIKPWGGSAAPATWFDCNGQALSRVDNAALYALIGTTYGAGDGSTTFNVPDFRGRAIVGAGTGSGLTARARGATGGAESHALSEAELAAHTHAYRGSSSGGGGGDFINQSSNNNANSTAEQSSPADTGSSAAHNNMQPWGCAMIIIKG